MKERFEMKIFNNSVSFVIYIFILELITKTNIGLPIIDTSTIRILISSLIFGIVLASISSFFEDNQYKLINEIIYLLLSIYTWFEINMYSYLGFFVGLGNAEQGTKITSYFKEFIDASSFKSYLPFLVFIVFILYERFLFKKFKEIKISIKLYFIYPIVISILLLIYYGSLTFSFMQNDLQTIKNIDLILTNTNSNLSVSQLGLYTYSLSDIIVSTFNIESLSSYSVNIDLKEKESVIKEAERNIDDTAWNSLIEDEKNKTYNNLNNFFINREITVKNDKTGIFKDKNLIVILMESVNYISIDKDRFPTIYKLWNDGISFRNNYSPRNNCSTGNNEMTVMTSLYTINNTCTANKYKNNIYPEAIFNIFNNSGYSVTSYHDYADHYYSRKTIHKNMGSTKYYNASDLGIKYSNVYEEWPSDVDLVKSSVPNFINEDKFMVFLTTVTTHQPYGVSSQYGNKNMDKVSDTNYSKSVKRYLSKMYELDSALELLLEELDKSGKLDDTVIALFCDHYPYGLSNKDINSVLDYDVNINNEVDRTPMIIYNRGVEKEIVNEYTSIIDLLPTLLNMFDLEYDPRLYLGHDIFSSYDHRVYFYDGSWQDNIGYYSSKKGKFYPIYEANSYENEDIKRINQEISLIQTMSTSAIKNNYFNYLNKQIKKYNKELESGNEN